MSHYRKVGPRTMKVFVARFRISGAGRLLSFVSLAWALAAPSLLAQQSLIPFDFSKYYLSASLQQPSAPANPPPDQPGLSNPPSEQQQTDKKDDSDKPAPQPKRILGVMPNFRAVSAGEIPPPPTPK